MKQSPRSRAVLAAYSLPATLLSPFHLQHGIAPRSATVEELAGS